MKYLFYAFLTIILFNCSQNIEIIDPEGRFNSNNKVINAFANANDSIVLVQIFKTVPFDSKFNVDDLVIKNATVELIINSTKTLQVPYIEAVGYKIKYVFKGGENLSLKIKIDSNIYTSNTTVPLKLQNIELKKNENGRFQLTWDGEQDSLRYYEVYKINHGKKTSSLYLERLYSKENFILSDSKTIKYDGVLKDFYSQIDIYKLYKNEEIELVVFSSNKMFFEYFDKNYALVPQLKNTITTQKPIGNVKGAFGYFGAFNQSTIKFKL